MYILNKIKNIVFIVSIFSIFNQCEPAGETSPTTSSSTGNDRFDINTGDNEIAKKFFDTNIDVSKRIEDINKYNIENYNKNIKDSIKAKEQKSKEDKLNIEEAQKLSSDYYQTFNFYEANKEYNKAVEYLEKYTNINNQISRSTISYVNKNETDLTKFMKIQLIKENIHKQNKKMINFYDKLINIKSKTNNQNEYLIKKAEFYEKNGYFELAIETYQECSELDKVKDLHNKLINLLSEEITNHKKDLDKLEEEKSNNIELKKELIKNLADAYNSKADLQKKMNIKEADENYQNALNEYKKIGDDQNIDQIFKTLKKEDESKEYFKKIITNLKKIENIDNFIKIGRIYKKYLDDEKNADIYFDKALEILDKQIKKGMNKYSEAIDICFLLEDIEKVKSYADKYFTYFQKLCNKNIAIKTKINYLNHIKSILKKISANDPKLKKLNSNLIRIYQTKSEEIRKSFSKILNKIKKFGNDPDFVEDLKRESQIFQARFYELNHNLNMLKVLYLEERDYQKAEKCLKEIYSNYNKMDSILGKQLFEVQKNDILKELKELLKKIKSNY
ncbi:MAG: hypothetical protein GY830_08320 [Bacteroidetes bacterium]|nr:hypothetical protein [Bacteroidota bacterium]